MFVSFVFFNSSIYVVEFITESDVYVSAVMHFCPARLTLHTVFVNFLSVDWWQIIFIIIMMVINLSYC